MRLRMFSGLAGACLLAAMIGCGKSDPTVPEGPPMNPGGMGGTPTGNAVFDKNCLGCHAASASPGGGPKRKGPNLAKVGAERNVEWLSDHVKDPKTHKPGSGMPEFASKLSPDEIKNVSEFMAGLK